MVNRKQFLSLSAASAAGLMLPNFLNGKQNNSTLNAEGDRFADMALRAVCSEGATYADVRIASAKTGTQQAGMRVLMGGAWGYAVTSDITTQGITKLVAEAMQSAKSAQKRYQYDLAEKHEVWRCAFKK